MEPIDDFVFNDYYTVPYTTLEGLTAEIDQDDEFLLLVNMTTDETGNDLHVVYLKHERYEGILPLYETSSIMDACEYINWLKGGHIEDLKFFYSLCQELQI